jgi:hypothetical protein
MIGKMRQPLTWLGLAVFFTTVVASCGSTSMKATWKDENYNTRPQKFFVVGLSKNEGARRMYESQFVTLLKSKGVDAYASYASLPEGKVDSVAAHRVIAELSCDAVLVTRVLDKKTVQSYYPPTTTYMGPSYYPSYYSGGWYGYYGYGYNTVTTPGYTTTEDYISLETNVYDVAGKRLVFSGLSETILSPSGPSEGNIKELAHVLADAMAKKGIIP